MKAELAAGKGAHQIATASPPHPHAIVLTATSCAEIFVAASIFAIFDF